MKIGLDVMGGDYAPEKTIEGAALALKEFNKNVELVFFGEKRRILSQLSKYNISENKFQIVDCPETIGMGEHAMQTLKTKPNSSIHRGYDSLKKGEIDGFAGAGNTAAMFVGGYYSVKAINGVLRPCISAIIPKENNKVAILLDVGINADCKPDVIYQFGILGKIFAQHVYQIKNPKVALLNLGEEKTKGNMLTQSSYRIMEEAKEYNFIGNIESRDLFDGEADVIVCDGFTGNIVVKQIEGFYKLIEKKQIKNKYFDLFNYEHYGGAPVLGFNKPVIIGHGISNEIAIKNMLLLTKNIINANLTEKIKNYLK